jgi:hypothetical protein
VKRFFQTLALSIAGTVIGLAFAEAMLRVLRPDLGSLANSGYVDDRSRVFVPRPCNFSLNRHPDTLVGHKVISNSLALRQHREFARRKPEGTLRVGVFGDSFTANLALPVQYSFTEPLDYLLSRASDTRVEVLNFGVAGYGTDQAYLRYADEGAALDLDVVVYMYFPNDLSNVLNNELFDLREDGSLSYQTAQQASLSRRLLRRLYITYLVREAGPSLDVLLQGNSPERARLERADDPRTRRKTYQRLSRLHGQGIQSDDVDRAIAIFTSLLTKMEQIAAANGSKLIVGLVPHLKINQFGSHYAKIGDLVQQLGIEVVDLMATVDEQDRPLEAYFFKGPNHHWNAEGNRLAAIRLFERVAEILEIKYGGDAFIERNLREYYGSFESSGGVLLQGSTQRAIRGRYLALENGDDKATAIACRQTLNRGPELASPPDAAR